MTACTPLIARFVDGPAPRARSARRCADRAGCIRSPARLGRGSPDRRRVVGARDACNADCVGFPVRLTRTSAPPILGITRLKCSSFGPATRIEPFMFGGEERGYPRRKKGRLSSRTCDRSSIAPEDLLGCQQALCDRLLNVARPVPKRRSARVARAVRCRGVGNYPAMGPGSGKLSRVRGQEWVGDAFGDCERLLTCQAVGLADAKLRCRQRVSGGQSGSGLERIAALRSDRAGGMVPFDNSGGIEEERQ